MKLYVTSDLHLEFGDLDLVNTDNVDVLILSGDILVAQDLINLERGDRIHGFLRRGLFGRLSWTVATCGHFSTMNPR